MNYNPPPKQDPFMLSTRDSLHIERKTHLKEKVWKRIFHENRREKEAGVAMLLADKIDFKT